MKDSMTTGCWLPPENPPFPHHSVKTQKREAAGSRAFFLVQSTPCQQLNATLRKLGDRISGPNFQLPLTPLCSEGSPPGSSSLPPCKLAGSSNSSKVLSVTQRLAASAKSDKPARRRTHPPTHPYLQGNGKRPLALRHRWGGWCRKKAGWSPGSSNKASLRVEGGEGGAQRQTLITPCIDGSTFRRLQELPVQILGPHLQRPCKVGKSPSTLCQKGWQ